MQSYHGCRCHACGGMNEDIADLDEKTSACRRFFTSMIIAYDGRSVADGGLGQTFGVVHPVDFKVVSVGVDDRANQTSLKRLKERPFGSPRVLDRRPESIGHREDVQLTGALQDQCTSDDQLVTSLLPTSPGRPSPFGCSRERTWDRSSRTSVSTHCNAKQIIRQ